MTRDQYEVEAPAGKRVVSWDLLQKLLTSMRCVASSDV